MFSASYFIKQALRVFGHSALTSFNLLINNLQLLSCMNYLPVLSHYIHSSPLLPGTSDLRMLLQHPSSP